MRALFDTNLFISYLLTSQNNRAIQTIFEALDHERFTLLLPEAVTDEILDVVTHRPHLIGKIGRDRLNSFLSLIESLAEIVPHIEQVIPAVGRDPKDDYLLTYAVVGQADYLVSGDKDLLVLGAMAGVKIISTVTFAGILSNP